ncbi:MAG: hypothetical protein AAFV53_10290 [Myxococcota bacterium]
MYMLTVALLWGSIGWSRDQTYCVGGFNGKPPKLTSTACNTPAVRQLHSAWHHHTYLFKDGVCYDCWDEVDNSCITDFLRNHPDFSEIRGRRCEAQHNAHEIIDHRIQGQPIQELQPRIDPPPPGPQEAGEALTLTGRVTNRDGDPFPVDGGRFIVETPDGAIEEVVGTPQPDGSVVGTIIVPDADDVQVTFIPNGFPGPQDAGGRLPLDVRRKPGFSLPETLDFGTIAAGALLSETCVALDLSESIGLEERAFQVSVAGLGGCLSAPHLAPSRSLKTPIIVESPGDSMMVCLAVPYCAGETAPADASLVITPTDPRFLDRAARVPMRWTVTNRSWLACHGIWLFPLLALVGVGGVIVGIVRPKRFPPEATITIASDPKGLKRSAPTRLRECRGARPGFYRDAQLGIHFDGSVNGRLRGAAARLLAVDNGVALIAQGALEVYDRRKRAWKTPEMEDGPLMPSPREVYRCGDVCFQIDPG